MGNLSHLDALEAEAIHSLFLILDDTELMYSDREGLWHVPCVL